MSIDPKHGYFLPLVLEVSPDREELIGSSDLSYDLTEEKATDMVLLHTGFKEFRGKGKYLGRKFRFILRIIDLSEGTLPIYWNHRY